MKIASYSFSNAQIILGLVALLFISISLRRYVKRERGQTLFKSFIAIAMWMGVLITALFPDFTRYVVRILGLGENFNTLIFATFVVIFVLLFRIIHMHEEMEKKMTELIRKIALKDIDRTKED